MLSLDPGEGRIATARRFIPWEGGGEYNVACGLRRCSGLRTSVSTALVENPVGRLIEDLMLQGGVDISLLKGIPYDFAHRTVRKGLNFTERGFEFERPLDAPTVVTPQSASCNRTTLTGRRFSVHSMTRAGSTQ